MSEVNPSSSNNSSDSEDEVLAEEIKNKYSLNEMAMGTGVPYNASIIINPNIIESGRSQQSSSSSSSSSSTPISVLFSSAFPDTKIKMGGLQHKRIGNILHQMCQNVQKYQWQISRLTQTNAIAQFQLNHIRSAHRSNILKNGLREVMSKRSHNIGIKHMHLGNQILAASKGVITEAPQLVDYEDTIDTRAEKEDFIKTEIMKSISSKLQSLTMEHLELIYLTLPFINILLVHE